MAVKCGPLQWLLSQAQQQKNATDKINDSETKCIVLKTSVILLQKPGTKCSKCTIYVPFWYLLYMVVFHVMVGTVNRNKIILIQLIILFLLTGMTFVSL